MNEEDASSCFLHLWQKENIDIENQKVGSQLDTLRFNLAQLQCLKSSFSDTDDAAIYSKTKSVLHQYGRLLDSQESGANNYAEPILALVGNNKNESKKWKSNLKSEDIVKKFFSAENHTSSALKDEYKVLAQYVNENDLDDRSSVIKEETPFSKRNIHLPVKKSSEAEKENKSDLGPSFDLMETELEGFCDIPFSEKNKQGKHYTAEVGRQVSDHEEKDLGNHPPFPYQGNRGGTQGGKYPWERVSASNRSHEGPFTEGMSGTGRSNYNHGPYIGANVDHQNRSLRGKAFGGACNRIAGNRNSSDFEMSVSNQESSVNERSWFKTASHQLALDQQKKQGYGRMSSAAYGSGKRSLGVRRTVNTKFVPPVRREEEEGYGSGEITRRCLGNNRREGGPAEESPYAELLEDERLKNIEPKMVELIMNEIMDSGLPVTWDDIAGLDLAKTTIQEIVVWPMLRPDIFTGLRGPPKGILLFGPPGTGKTMIGKCIACQSGSTFFSISASSLTSKWVGEGEKMVRAMFAVARCHQPAVIFIDEIDSLLTQRSDTEHESSRRIKTEFLVQLDGATSGSDERLLVVGATNRPQELDEAARRRLVKRLYIPLPDTKARQQIVENLMGNQSHSLTANDIQEICQQTDGYSGADMANLCREAALGPIRSISFSDIKHISVDQVRPIRLEDFISALRSIRASVSDRDLQMYEDWNHKYGISAR